jgi:repressor LexA
MARKTEGLGKRHEKIMHFLSDFQERKGFSPSIRDIGENIGVKSTSLVDYYLNQLEEMGMIKRDKHISRSICIQKSLETAPSVTERINTGIKNVSTAINEIFSIPVLGRIVASEPIPMPASDVPFFDQESSIEIARSLLPARENTENLFALEVQGDSMVDAMVNDGDMVIMRRAQQAENGDMVAVWLDDKDETTLKYFYKEPTRVRLQPANPNMGPIYVDNPQHLRIMGKVVMVIRQVKSIAA